LPKFYQHFVVYTFHISLHISVSDTLGSLTTSPAVMYTQLQTWVVLLSTRNTVELRKQLNFCYPLLRQELVNFNHCFFICIQISNIFGLPIYLKLTNCIFQISSLYFFFCGSYGPGINCIRNE